MYSEDAQRYDAQQSSSGLQGDMAALAVALLGQVRAAAGARLHPQMPCPSAQRLHFSLRPALLPYRPAAQAAC